MDPLRQNIHNNVKYSSPLSFPPSVSFSASFIILQALRYMELLPPERRPIAGTQGADYRKKQMAKQLPEHDQDPTLCHELTPAEVKQMEQYVRKYKDEALGMGDLTMPEEMGTLAAGARGPQGLGFGAAGVPGAGSAPGDKAALGKAGIPAGPGAISSSPAGNYVSSSSTSSCKKGLIECCDDIRSAQKLEGDLHKSWRGNMAVPYLHHQMEPSNGLYMMLTRAAVMFALCSQRVPDELCECGPE